MQIKSYAEIREPKIYETNNTVLISEEDFPDILVISSTGTANTAVPWVMGTYLRMPWITKEDKPVWKKYGYGQQDYFLFSRVNFRWLVGTNFQKAWISTVRQDLTSVPAIHWRYWYGAPAQWVYDDKLRVQTEGIHS